MWYLLFGSFRDTRLIAAVTLSDEAVQLLGSVHDNSLVIKGRGILTCGGEDGGSLQRRNSQGESTTLDGIWPGCLLPVGMHGFVGAIVAPFAPSLVMRRLGVGDWESV